MLSLFSSSGILNPEGIVKLIQSVFHHGTNLLTLSSWVARLYPEKMMLSGEDETITYSAFHQKAMNLSRFFTMNHPSMIHGKTAVIASNSINMLAACFGASGAGSDITLISTEVSEEQFRKMEESIGFGLVIKDKALTLQPKSPVFNLSDPVVFVPIKTNDFPQPPNRYWNKKISTLTSGSTGDPKSARRTTSIFAFLQPFHSLLRNAKLNEYQSVVVTTPLYHGYGLATSLMAMCLGSHIHIRKHFKASEICELIEKHKIEVITLVPLVLRRILNESETNLTSLKAILSGGAALEESLVTNTHKRLGKILFNLYGTSEAGFCILANPDQLKRNPSTIGKPIEGVRIRINEPEKSYGCGELLVKNRWSVSRTKWIRTGDLARINEDGFIKLMGRSDDMIVSGGVNVYPIELENLLFQHPNVELVKVAGIQDDEFGQRLKAYLVLKQGSIDNETEIMEWIRHHGNRFIVPKSIQILHEIPHNEIGKINIRNLPDIDL